MSERFEFDKPAFTPTKLEEQRGKDDVFTVRLNAKERAMLNQAKQSLRMDSDGTTLKLLAEIGNHVLQTTFPADVLSYIASYRRVRKVV